MRTARGFTLIEIMVVVVIMGVMIAGGVLALGLADGGDRALTRTRERLTELMDYARERAELEGRDYGLIASTNGARFVTYDAQSRTWVDSSDDLLAKSLNLPADWQFTAIVEGRPVLLKPMSDSQDKSSKEKTAPPPVAVFYAGGELSEFELRLGDNIEPARVVFRGNNAPEDRSNARSLTVPQPRIDILVSGKPLDAP